MPTTFRSCTLGKLFEAYATFVLVVKIFLANLSALTMNHGERIENIRYLYPFEPPRPFRCIRVLVFIVWL